MKQLGYTLLAIVLTCHVMAQSSDLVVHSDGGRLYLNHTVAPKENLYSIGRLYNISPKEIAPFNGLTLTSGLEIDQSIRIPLNATNFVQQGVAGSDEMFVPLYYIVAEKEGLFRVGQNVHKVSVDNLKKWNNLSSESINTGQQLVVGYLKVKKDLSSLAANGIKKIGGAVTIQPPVATTSPTPDITQAPVATTANQPPAQTNNNPTVQPAVNTTTNNSNADNSTEGIGFFKTVYQQQAKSNGGFRNETGSAAVFKSTSGWQDSKYYALMNNIAPGTIVRITNASNNRIIFAKVLGELPPGKENDGLIIRISNAAAAELKVNEKEPKFEAEVAYARS